MIKVGTLAKIRRLYFRDKQSIKEICRQTGMSRNTVRSWLRDPEMVEPTYPARVVVSKLDAYSGVLLFLVRFRTFQEPLSMRVPRG